MKVKQFTHTDLDGIGSAIVGANAFSDIDITYCDYPNVNEKILNFLENEKVTDYDRIFITDITPNEEVAEKLDLVFRGGVSGVQIVDHHGTARWLAEKYPEWCIVETTEAPLFPEEREEVASSGTSLFYKFLRDKHIPNIESNRSLKVLAETVRRYDSWEWHNVYQDEHPKRLNDLFFLIGRGKFFNRFSHDPLPTFTDTELILLDVEEQRIKKYIDEKKREVEITHIVADGKPYRMAYVFAENYSSQLGNAIGEHYRDEADFVALFDVGKNKVSLRGVHEGIDLGKDIAKYFSDIHGTRGGGHPRAGAFEFKPELAKELMKESFNEEEKGWIEQHLF